jgi:hypothetical protein
VRCGIDMRLKHGVLSLLTFCLPLCAAAQSTSATAFGVITDEQRAILSGAVITLENLDTGDTRAGTSDARGEFRIIGLVPGRYEVRAALAPFVEYRQSDVVLRLSEETSFTLMLRLAALREQVTVRADTPIGGLPATTLGRGFTAVEIEGLPVAARDFASLATLVPGIGSMAESVRTTATGLTSAGQTGRNNTFLIDGLTIDDRRQSNLRGSLSLDAIKEFMVLSNSYNAEYGQASGAIVSVLTRSGTNQYAGRAFYYHRDDAWDATPGAARLVSPHEAKSSLQQQILGGVIGGPLARDHAFFFGSTEQTNRDTEQFVTSAVLQAFRPGADARLPVESRSTLAFVRGDVNLAGASLLTVRYRLDRNRATNQTADSQPAGLISPERHADVTRVNQDAAVLNNHVFGARGLNELKFQGGRRANESDVTDYCLGCLAENRPGILLGKSPTSPNAVSEHRWQVVDALTWLPPRAAGEHMLKLGIDASLVREAGIDPAGFDGIFTFATNAPFNPSNAATYPTRYLRNEGNPETDFRSGVYAVFAQDSWRATPRVTVNAGLRWDYADAPGISHDVDNVAPRIGVAFTPSSDARTTLRGSYGVFYDEMLFIISSNALRADSVTQTLFANPGYPDPFGVNPRRSGSINVAIPSTTRLAADMQTPSTEQATVGVRQMWARLAITADVVWARGRHLLRSFDLNYPDLDNLSRPRPDPTLQRVLVRDAKGHSWYRGLQVGLQKHYSARHSYSVSYTLSRSERDTEDFDFLAQDQRNYAAERGPSATDARHRLAASSNVELPMGLRFTLLLTARSALPYNITTGADDNGDLAFTDRPLNVSRNSARSEPAWQLDGRLSRIFRIGRQRIELLADVFNTTNHPNWTAFDGVITNFTFGQPTSSTDARQVQFGVRVDF